MCQFTCVTSFIVIKWWFLWDYWLLLNLLLLLKRLILKSLRFVVFDRNKLLMFFLNFVNFKGLLLLVILFFWNLLRLITNCLFFRWVFFKFFTFFRHRFCWWNFLLFIVSRFLRFFCRTIKERYSICLFLRV